MHADKSLFLSSLPLDQTPLRIRYHVPFLSLQCVWVRVKRPPKEVVARYRGNGMLLSNVYTQCFKIRHFWGSRLRQKGKNHLCKIELADYEFYLMMKLLKLRSIYNTANLAHFLKDIFQSFKLAGFLMNYNEHKMMLQGNLSDEREIWFHETQQILTLRLHTF